MSPTSSIRSLYSLVVTVVFAATVVLAPAATYAASQAKHGHAKAPHSTPSIHLAAPQHEQPHFEADTWMMFPVSFAAIGFAIRRQRHALGSLQPLVSLS
jgi:hypothetical protein